VYKFPLASFSLTRSASQAHYSSSSSSSASYGKECIAILCSVSYLFISTVKYSMKFSCWFCGTLHA